jgi:hypothetical protein
VLQSPHSSENLILEPEETSKGELLAAIDGLIECTCYQGLYQANSRQWDNIIDQNIVYIKRQICSKQFAYKGKAADPPALWWSGYIMITGALPVGQHFYVLPEFMYTTHEARTISH